ncbi:hypothetical protein [Mycolicibacterium arenosum]|uniref:VirB8 protein n=1 Tax=Mycolicibacterium arenosum TaxID=2952157 RepID=A0ABT1M2H8_9MYCO|nr:hypothetical protein [Mycolicibacterium sp. CAU 1645]MCP9273353.1 hypothetical protein [Mycolicibacterium sp. CAU 1645]
MTNADDALAAAEAAEAEAAEAEAVVVAARARARALRLRREADAAAAKTEAAESEATGTGATDVVSSTVSLDKPSAISLDKSSAISLDESSATTEVDTSSETPVVETSDADVETTDAVPSADPDVVDTPMRRRFRRRPPAALWKVAATVVSAIVIVGLLALSAAMYVSHRNVQTQQRKSAEFEAAARQGVVTLMSLDHTRAQQDVDRIIAITTGDFKKDFESQAADMVTVAVQNKVVTTVTVNAIAVQKMTDDTATVAIAAISTVSNTASEKQEPRAWRLSVDVARDGDQIKLAKVEFVP